MKLFPCLSLLLLAAASEPAHPDAADVAPAAFRLWKPSDGHMAWTSDGVRIAIAPAPCESPPRTEGCRWDPQNNQVEVTITSAETAPFTVRTDDQSSFYRVAVVRFHAGDRRPGVMIENESGGSSDDVRVQLLIPSDTGYGKPFCPAISKASYRLC